jgi:CheY-like chemotaxis protein
VDCDAASQSSLEALLCGWRLNVKFADGVADAVAEIWEASQHASPYDLVLIDAVLSQTNGFELARIIKKDSELQATPLILLFSGPEGDIRENASGAGFAAALSKPLCTQELLDVLHRLWSEVDNSPAPVALSFESKLAVSATAPPEQSSNGIVFTKERLLSNYGDEDLLKWLVTLFLDQLPELISEMDAALREKNLDSLGRTAHSLKGSVSNFGAKNARQLAENLQSAATNGDLEAAAATALQLKAELKGVIEVLRTYQ